MWIIVVFGCFGAIVFQSNAQDVTGIYSQTVTQTPLIDPTIKWNTNVAESDLKFQDGRSNSAQGVPNEVSNHPIYSNQWRTFVRPAYFNPYRDQNTLHIDSEDAQDHEFKPTFMRNPDSDDNSTMPFMPYSNAEIRYPVFSDSVSHYPYPSRTVQSQFASAPAPVRQPIFYPNAVSINLRRSYSTNVRDLENSTDALPGVSVPEPVTSSYEERYTQVLPNPFPTMPFVPNHYMPFGSFRNQRGYYPPPAPFYFQPYPIPPPRAEESHPVHFSNVNSPQFYREADSEIVENVPVNPHVPELERPVPEFHSPVENIPHGPQIFVQPSPLQDTIGRSPFMLPPPVFSPFLPNPMASRALPMNPLGLPEVMGTPRENPSIEVMSEPVLVDRLPSQSNPKALMLDDSSPDSSVSGSLQTEEEILAEDNLKPSRIPYGFGYDMTDGKGTDQHRMEVSDASGVVTGSYGYKDMFGVYRLVNYIADKNGFRAFVKSNEPGVASSGSADVVVIADHPPPVVEGTYVRDPEAVIVPEPADLIAEVSERVVE